MFVRIEILAQIVSLQLIVDDMGIHQHLILNLQQLPLKLKRVKLFEFVGKATPHTLNNWLNCSHGNLPTVIQQ